jgi:hypothetical protein
MKEIIIAWGLNGCLGVSGCYLIISGIIGKLIPVKPVMSRGIRLQRSGQRALLGLFGVALSLPVLVAAYKDLVFDVKTVTTAPAIEEYVAPKPVALLPTGSLLQPIVYSSGCEIREAFGLAEQQSRQLKYENFRGIVWVGVDQISTLKGSSVYLKVSDKRRDFKAQKKGDYLDFAFEGRQYRLTVAGIYSALVGPSKLAFEVCEP